MPDEPAPILYRFPPALPGVELVQGRRIPRLVRLFHTNYGLAATLTGGAERYYRGRSYETAPGAVMVMVPGETHAMLRYAPETRYLVVRFTPERVAAHAEALGLPPREVTFDRARLDDPILSARLMTLAASIEREAPALLQQELESELLTRLLSRYGARPCPVARSPQRAFSQARDLLLADLAAAVTLDDLARAAGLSKSQVGRVFKRATGMGPHAFQLAARLSRARDLLRAGVPAGDAAARLGFADQSHFSRHFVRQFGIAPARFARL